jgi:hypothetical protein
LQNWHPVGCQLDANFILSAASRMQISFSRLPAGCKFNSVGHQPDANCIQPAALQYKILKLINSLHVASNQPNEFCIRLAASRMQILQK